jgi:acylphosphatase
MLVSVMHHVHLVIEGRVQGVGFRWFAQSHARLHGVVGTVRNRHDGAVEIDAEGERPALERFVEDVRRGPRSAHVDRLEQSWSEGPSRHREFVIAR